MCEKKQKINESISRIFLIIFVVMALTSGLLLSVAGNYTLWYIVMGFCLVPVLLLGSQKIRIYASLGLVLTFILIMVDYSNGKSHATQMLKLKLNMRDMHYSKQIDELKEKLKQYEKHTESLHQTSHSLGR